ncbi:MAG: phosphodiester glycosidase family protein, partial [Ferruginibacter sp.]
MKTNIAARIIFIICIFPCSLSAQMKWQNSDAAFAPLPKGFHVYKTTDSLDGKPFIAYYASISLKNHKLKISVDTTLGRRLTPDAFYHKNNNPLLVVNCSFFSFESNQNLNVIVQDKKLVSHNVRKVRDKKDTTVYHDEPMLRGALGIHNHKADIAWVRSDSTQKNGMAYQHFPTGDSVMHAEKWKVDAGVGGGPVILQDGQIAITNNQEKMFAGKALEDMHPRTLIGYTPNQTLIIMVIQGRFPGLAEGATLTQEARLMQELGCVEALNLDGGGSSCML